MEYKNYELWKQYVDDVSSGKLASCIYIRQAVDRFKEVLKRPNVTFREDEVTKAIKFASLFKDGAKPIVLSPWQQFWLANVVGVYVTETDEISGLESTHRLYTQSYLEVARGAGKSTLMAILAIYFLAADGEWNADSFVVANSAKQSGETFRKIQTFAKQIDPKLRTLKICRDNIKLSKTNSKCFCLASDPNKLDGYNCFFGIVDEYHQAANDLCLDALTRSQVKRMGNTHVAIITTAGLSKDCPCYEVRTMCEKILNGTITNDSYFGMIFTLDEDDDWRDPAVWIKANPNLGVSMTTKGIKAAVEDAIANPSKEFGVQVKHFNMWQDVKSRWIPEEFLKKCWEDQRWQDFAGKHCYVGIDLSNAFDLAAMSVCYKDDDGVYHIKTKYYLPETAIENAETNVNSELYDRWNQRGYLTLQQTKAFDWRQMVADLEELRNDKGLFIDYIFYDQWHAQDLADSLDSLGYSLQPFGQTAANMNTPIMRFEGEIANEKIKLDKNPINNFCIRNVVLKMTAEGNRQCDKTKSANKIDGCVTMLMALAACIYHPEVDFSM